VSGDSLKSNKELVFHSVGEYLLWVVPWYRGFIEFQWANDRSAFPNLMWLCQWHVLHISWNRSKHPKFWTTVWGARLKADHICSVVLPLSKDMEFMVCLRETRGSLHLYWTRYVKSQCNILLTQFCMSNDNLSSSGILGFFCTTCAAGLAAMFFLFSEKWAMGRTPEKYRFPFWEVRPCH
jgi:hypothetical protein